MKEEAPAEEPAEAKEETPAEEPAEAKEEPPAEAKEEAPAEEPAETKEEAPAEETAEAVETEEVPAMELADAGKAAAPKEPAAAEKAGGMPPVPVPDDNPMTPEKIELGKLLYFDTRLSADGTISCATCHDPKMGWAEHRPTSEGIKGQLGPVNAPPVINAAYAPAQFWDGRAATLEEQALGPIENPKEMGHTLPECVKQLNEIPAYKERFQNVFQTDVTADGIAKAIAAFERTIVSGESPYDRYVAGAEDALSGEQKEGWELFDGVGCSVCHKPPLFSTYMYVNAGIGMDEDPPFEGRKAVTGKDADLGKVKVPSLREVADTAPYFHDGSAATLEDAVAVMAAGGKDNPNLTTILKGMGGSLSAEEQQKIVAFLKALTSDYPKTEPPELP
jgi:cytochrome c peroxidase